jgi:hypothetical protein
MNELNINLIVSIVALGSALFAIFKAVKDPDAKNEKAVALLKEQLNTERLVTAETVKTMQNCVHTVEGKIETLTSNLNSQAILIGKLETIINERIPKKEA